MYHHTDYDVLSDASEATDRLRASEAAGGNVRWVNLSERSTEYLRVFTTEKRYTVSYHSWSD